MVNMIRNIKFLVEIFAYLFCLSGLFGKKFKLSIHAVILIILDLFLLTGIGHYGFPSYLRSLIYIALFLYSLTYYGENIKNTLVNCLLAAMILTVIQLVFCLPLYFLGINTYEKQEGIGLFINILCISFLYIFRKWLSLKKLSDFFLKRDKIIYFIAISILICLGINLYQIRANRYIEGEQYVQLIYFILILGFTVGELQKSRTDAEKKKTQLEMNSFYYDAYDQLIMLVRERQHDTKNHINAILSMIYTTNNYEELVAKQKEYCDFIIEQNEETKLLLSVGNPLIAGFLYSRVQKAKSKFININYQFEMKTSNLPFPEYEFVEILGILLDNAEEALQKLEEKDKKMFVTIKENSHTFEIVVANISDVYDEDLTERFFEAGYSCKGSGRGIGLYKLRRLVNAKNGEILVSNEMYGKDNYLTFCIKISK